MAHEATRRLNNALRRECDQRAAAELQLEQNLQRSVARYDKEAVPLRAALAAAESALRDAERRLEAQANPSLTLPILLKCHAPVFLYIARLFFQFDNQGVELTDAASTLTAADRRTQQALAASTAATEARDAALAAAERDTALLSALRVELKVARLGEGHARACERAAREAAAAAANSQRRDAEKVATSQRAEREAAVVEAAAATNAEAAAGAAGAAGASAARERALTDALRDAEAALVGSRAEAAALQRRLEGDGAVAASAAAAELHVQEAAESERRLNPRLPTTPYNPARYARPPTTPRTPHPPPPTHTLPRRAREEERTTRELRAKIEMLEARVDHAEKSAAESAAHLRLPPTPSASSAGADALVAARARAAQTTATIALDEEEGAHRELSQEAAAAAAEAAAALAATRAEAASDRRTRDRALEALRAEEASLPYPIVPICHTLPFILCITRFFLSEFPGGGAVQA